MLTTETAFPTSGIQPVDGRSAKQITNFATGLIFDFTWSYDRKQARGTVNSDVILISNVK